MKTLMRLLGAALTLGVVATPALAGGPNYMYDEANKLPYRWHLDTWPNGAVPVHTDLGGLGLMDNTMTTNWVRGALAQWSNVPTSSYKAEVVGTVADFGLGDITPANVDQVFPSHFNGGGITVVYDYDGKIFRDYLGLGLDQVLGIALPEYVEANSDEILEYTVFLNGYMQWFNDTDGKGYSGIMTHELGHAANLSHSQGNGSVYNNSLQEYPWPNACPTGPYSGGMHSGPSREQIETMYPFINHQITGSGEFQFTVDKLDDISAISDLYPEPGWPENYGTIKGTIRSLTKVLGNGGGPTQEITGVNLVARNLADPYNDFISAVSGGLTRGANGPDGTFEMHGLTPGAQYVLYVDTINKGGYPYPSVGILPGPEEWYNGALESGDGTTDDRCAWTPIAVADHTSSTADITFNSVKGQPSFRFLLDFPAGSNIPATMNADGSVIVGTRLSLDGYWMWSDAGGYKEIGGFARGGGLPGISDDGSKISGNILENGVYKWGLYDVATQTWTGIAPPATTPTNCTVNIEGITYVGYGTAWGISGDGSTVVGGTYNNRSSVGTCRKQRATKWTAAGGSVVLPKASPDLTTNNSRANYASYDGSVIAGQDDSGANAAGAYWVNGVEHGVGGSLPVTAPTYFGSAVSVTRDGSTVTGGTGVGNVNAGAYLASTGILDHTIIGNPPTPFLLNSIAWRANDAGNVVGGFDRVDANFVPRVWTPEIGWSLLQDFLRAQGVWMEGYGAGPIQSMSADGRTWAVVGLVPGGIAPLIIEIPKAIVCHKAPGSTGAPKNLDVTFPEGLADHLAHGDTLGICQNGGE